MHAAQNLALAHRLILDSLSALPLGTPLHTAMFKVAKDLGEHLQKADEDVRMSMQTMMAAAHSQRIANQQAMLSRMAGQPGPNAPPAMSLPPPGPPPGGPPGGGIPPPAPPGQGP